MTEVSTVHRRIANTYVDDFAKYANGAELALMQQVFRALPARVCEKVKYVNYSREVKAAKVSAAIDLFIKAGIACPAIHSDSNGIPLGAEEEPSVRKLLFLDVGIMNYANGLSLSRLAQHPRKGCPGPPNALVILRGWTRGRSTVDKGKSSGGLSRVQRWATQSPTVNFASASG